MSTSRTTATRKYPGIPTVTGDPTSHTAAIQALSESVNIHERRTKDVLSSFISVRDLVELGIIKVEGDRLVRVD